MSSTVMQKVDLTSSSSEIVFSGISGFDDLFIIMTLRSNYATNRTDGVAVRLNDIATGFTSLDTYSRHRYTGSSIDVSTPVATNQYVGGRCPTSASTSGQLSYTRMTIPSYSESGWPKCILTEYKHVETGAEYTWFGKVGSTWSSTVPVTTITVYPADGSAWEAGSVATLYGLKAS